MAIFCACIRPDFAVKPGSSLLRRPDREGAAVHPLDQALSGELLDVAPHRHVGDAELLDQLGHANRATLLHEPEDGGATLARKHLDQSSLTTATPPGAA